MEIEHFSGSNIISLEPMRTKVKFPAISMIESYWEGLRNSRSMPTRAEVDPRGISDALEFAFILEEIAPGHARIRLAGGHLNDLIGMEVRGMPLTSLFLPEARMKIQTILGNVLATPESVHLDLESDTGFTRPNLEAQMYLAPMRDESGAPTRILGALQSVGRIGRAPRRFNVASVKANTVRPGKNRPRTATKSQQVTPGFAEHTKGFKPAKVAPKPENTEKPSYLQLVCNNDA